MAAQQRPCAGLGSQYGYYSDSETGLQLLGYRYYDPAEGRFVNRDPIGMAGGVNVYGYVGNDAGNGADPEGLVRIWRIGKGTIPSHFDIQFSPQDPWPGNPLGGDWHKAFDPIARIIGISMPEPTPPSFGFWPGNGRWLPLLWGKGQVESPDPDAPANPDGPQKGNTPVTPEVHDPGFCMRLYGECVGQMRNPPPYSFIYLPGGGNCGDWAARMWRGAKLTPPPVPRPWWVNLLPITIRPRGGGMIC
ncbi:MAG: RHS repeat-associated core domain-containing protein [Armatimonadetes bacterium]|nr:RHS repeat-associated core domain-containing protein [Armatimonadota bacterium]MDE2205758.1 RHS repeat-associated core domain-containing protein [Armatimonadota bacterium]